MVAILVFGCNEDEFLNEVPVSVLSTKSFFETSNQFGQAVNAAYSNLRPLAGTNTGSGVFWAFGEMRSDNSTFQDNSIDKSGHVYWNADEFKMGASTGAIDLQGVAWNNCYEGIGKCNIVLQYSEEKEYENKDRYIAEVKFLRALYYFYLVHWFGDVPLVTEPANSYLGAFEGNKRVSTDLVYDQIVTDLNDAKQNLPKSYTSGNFGRATEGAARALLANVLMWRNQYSDAATELEAVITGNDFPLFRYPHVLLMLAECYVRAGGGDPVSLVNQVRDRAGLPALSTVTLDNIIHERRIEFHCEADRWDVLVRTGKAVEVMTAHGQQERANRPTVIRGDDFKTIRILFPIPTSVLENDPTMKQNPEYL